MNKITTFTEYSARCEEVQMDTCRGLDYLDLGLCSETSEITGDLIAKSIRGDFKLSNKAPEIMHESGDACWFSDRECVARGTTLALMLLSDDIEEVDRASFSAGVASGFDKLSDAELARYLLFYATCIVMFGHNPEDLSRNLQLYFAHLVVLLHRYGYTLMDAINFNVNKLADRKAKNALMGSGETIEERKK